MTAGVPLTQACITATDPSQGVDSVTNLLAFAPPALIRQAVIRPTLRYLGLSSRAAEDLLLGTLLTVGALPQRKQPEGGIGPYAISRATHTRIWDEYLAISPDHASLVRGLASQRCFLQDPHAELGYNFAYATAIAWLVYRQQLGELDDDMDIVDLAQLWQSLYPHRGGLRTDFLDSWEKANQEMPVAWI